MKIVKAILTCSACPTQWNAWDSEGRYWYLRYRFGKGSAVHSESEDTLTVHELNHPEFSFNTGDEWDGSTDLPTFCRLAGIELQLEGMSRASTDSAD